MNDLSNPSSEIKELHWLLDMLTNVDVGILVLDSGYEIHTWNRFMEDHSGIRESDAKHNNLFKLFPDLPKEWLEHKIDSVFSLKSRAFSTWEQRQYLFKFKTYRPITGTEEYMYQNSTMIPLTSADGTVNHVCLLIYDVTDAAAGQKQLENVNLELQKLSRTDQLTDLYNRGYWEERFQIEYESCLRYSNDSSVMIFDIDHFKKVNDTFGHQAGDEVIRQTASLAKDMARKMDVIGRYGGEEFVIFLPNTLADSAYIFAERFRQAIEQKKIVYQGDLIPYTVSIGICEFNKELSSYESWIEKADQALYYGKENGRNKTTVFGQQG